MDLIPHTLPQLPDACYEQGPFFPPLLPPALAGAVFLLAFADVLDAAAFVEVFAAAIV